MTVYRVAFRTICYLSIWFVSLSYAQDPFTEQEVQTKKIDKYYNAEVSKLDFDEVIQLARDIVPNRKKYDPNTLAKTYALLAKIAEIKGESSRSYQLTLFGLTYQPINPEVELNLKLKLVAGYFFNNQYEELLNFIEEVILSAERERNNKYRIQALAYRAMANALLGKHQESLIDLLAVERVINSNQSFADYVELFEILAISQHYLGNNDASLRLYEKVLQQRFQIDKLLGIETTYTQLGGVYLSLGRLDDAYNAFWEAKRYASEFQLPIKIAYAEFGLGKVLLKQEHYERAFKALIEAENSFKGQGLNGPYLNSLIELILASQKTQRVAFANQLLLQASDMAKTTEIRSEQSELYRLLSNFYQQQGDVSKALSMLQKYIEVTQTVSQRPTPNQKGVAEVQVEKGKVQALKVAEISDNKNTVSEQVAQKNRLVLLLLLTSVLFLIIIVFLWLSMRSLRLKYVYEQDERPNSELPQSTETKRQFHVAFKMARKYQYPISVGYIAVNNWQDITCQYNKKVVSEVSKTIATIINKHIGEFDYAGQINEGQYLIIYPHQKNDESLKKMDKIIDELKVRFFANLGGFSVNIVFSLDAPSVQDIDPYIFLSRLIDT